jgi:hypothetical protein
MGMGNTPWEITDAMSEGEKEAIRSANKACFGV